MNLEPSISKEMTQGGHLMQGVLCFKAVTGWLMASGNKIQGKTLTFDNMWLQAAVWPGPLVRSCGVRPRCRHIRVALFTPQGGSANRTKWPCIPRRPSETTAQAQHHTLVHMLIWEPESLMDLGRCAGTAQELCLPRW